MFGDYAEMLYFCSRKDKKDRMMLNMNAYFYGYYFYFAGNCEADCRK